MPQPQVIPRVNGESLVQGSNRYVQRALIIRVPKVGATNLDPLAAPNCPKRGDILPPGSEFSSFSSPSLVVSDVRTVKYLGVIPNVAGTGSDDIYEVVVDYSDKFNPGIDIPKTWTYTREEFKVPFFRGIQRFYKLAGGTFTPPTGCPASPISGFGYKYEWFEDPLTIYVPSSIMTQTVWVSTSSFDFRERQKIVAQIGKLHLFGFTTNPTPDEKGVIKARFEPPRIVQEDRLRTRIEYAWTTDPGNGPFAQDTNACRRYIIPAIPRQPWHRYRVIPAANLLDPPEIETYDTMPTETTNPFYQPNGWKPLIGLSQVDGNPI